MLQRSSLIHQAQRRLLTVPRHSQALAQPYQTSLYQQTAFRHYSTGNKQQSQQSGSSFASTALVMGGLMFATYFGLRNKLAEAAENQKEVEIDFASEMQEGDKKVLKVGENEEEDRVLITKFKGKIYAIGNFCSHFGVELQWGTIFEDKILCPAHAAGFNIVTGESDGGPGLDGVPTFPVVEHDGKFFVQIPEGKLPRKVQMPVARRDPANMTHFLIIGAGAAGLNAADTLRQSGFTGQVTLLTSENYVPYDRTLLTKATAVGDPNNWKLRSEQYLGDADIDVKLDTTVVKIDPKEKTIITTRQEIFHYDKLLIASGSDVTIPNVKGADLKGVFPLRTGKDMLAIKAAVAPAQKVIVIGGSFIGSETAASLKGSKFGADMTIDIVNSSDHVFSRQFGDEVGKMMDKEHEMGGVRVHNNARLQQINDNGKGEVASVTLSDGRTLEADLVILGTGCKPRTQFLENTGIEMAADGSVIVDPFMQTNYVDIFAAGDIANYAYFPTGQRMRTEHWNHALDQGTNAAFNMLGKLIPNASVPFFWTRNYNKSIQFVGTAQGHTEIFYSGDVAEQKFVAYYIDDKDRVIGACGMNNAATIYTIREAIAQNAMPRGSEIKEGKATTASIAARLKQTGGCHCKRAACCRKKPVAGAQ